MRFVISVITDKIRKDDEAAEITNEWKFAAMVVDRLCLIVFTGFTVVATLAVLASAPQVSTTNTATFAFDSFDLTACLKTYIYKSSSFIYARLCKY